MDRQIESLNIVLVCISLRGGGTERIVCRIANHLVPHCGVSIITLVSGESFYRLDERIELVQPLAAIKRHGKALRLVFQFRHLFSACMRIRPDICFVFGEDISGMASLVARLGGIKEVWTFFRGTPGRSLKGANGIVNPFISRFIRRIMVQTQAAKECLAGPYPAEKIEVWPNPIGVPETVTPASDRVPIVINVGSIGRLKNQDALLRIYSSLARPCNWRLVFIGDGPRRGALEAEASRLVSSDSVVFAGERQDVTRYLDQAAIFAFTSLSEGFPNALAEAMAAGCACISYDCPTGPSEMIEHGSNGFLVESGDETEFARLLQILIDDADLRSRFSVNARKSIRKYESAMVMEQLKSMLDNDNWRTKRGA